MSKIYLAFDPGDTLGYAVWSESDGVVALREFGQHEQIDLHNLLERLVPDPSLVKHVIIEDYILWGKLARQQSGSKMPAAQGKGMLILWCKMHGIPYTLQKSDILSVAVKWSQQPIPKKHAVSHQIVAFNHGFYWLHKQGLIKTALEEEKANG